ncbi:MAG: hypothetical protein PWR10_1846 [Halanaerobiales bacterium]|nr:hypothetical protein [Halanaerobiales bacterium]
MEIQIDRKNGIPIYIQIKKQIKRMIEKGILSKGDRLPPERELAGKLGVSRNRVSTAYKELEAEKIIISRQGKGTFVAGKISGVREASRKDKLLKIIDLAMEEAAGLGFSLDDFLTIAYVRAKEKEEMLSKIKVAFIECNKEQLSALIKEIELEQNVASIPVLIGELRNDPARVKRVLSRAEIIVTTPFHLEEVEEFIAGMEKQIIDMTLEPGMDTIIELARIKTGKKLGLVCQSDSFATEVKGSLKKIGLNNLDFKYTTKEGDELERFLAANEILITSPHRFQEVKDLLEGEKQVICFNYSPDRGSVNMLKMALFDLKGD